MIVFYCKNSLLGNEDFRKKMSEKYNLECKEFECSGDVELIEILRKFEKEENLVIVGCLEGNCRYRMGSNWARKRAESAKKIIGEIGLDRSLTFINASRANESKFENEILKIVKR
ncbi:MAG: hydrogenase iron-sulfur subunit [Thermoplasmata archaeon]